MPVQDAARTVTVPQQAGPADPPLTTPITEAAAPAPAPEPLLGRDRPMTPDERHFAIGIAVLFFGFTAILLTGLLMAQYVWA
jgi:hypothetical protein